MFKGKALLVINRLDTDNPKKFQWDIQPYVQSQNKEDPGGEIQEAFGWIEYDSQPAPAKAYKMEVGDTLRVLVSFEIHYSFDSFTREYDAELHLVKERVLRYQSNNSRRSRKKFYQAKQKI